MTRIKQSSKEARATFLVVVEFSLIFFITFDISIGLLYDNMKKSTYRVSAKDGGSAHVLTACLRRMVSVCMYLPRVCVG